VNELCQNMSFERPPRHVSADAAAGVPTKQNVLLGNLDIFSKPRKRYVEGGLGQFTHCLEGSAKIG
jgi:hypothetical protein